MLATRHGQRQVLFATGSNPVGDGDGGGLASYVRAHALAATAAGFDVHVFCLGHQRRVTSEAFGTVHQVAIPPHTIRAALAGLYSPLLALALDRHARNADPALVHGSAPTAALPLGSPPCASAGGCVRCW